MTHCLLSQCIIVLFAAVGFAISWETPVKTIFQCDQVVSFNETNRSKGEFVFPELPREPTDAKFLRVNTTRAPNLQCVYTFIAGPGQRVKLEFEHFQLAGSSESCEIEYVDIYSELQSIEDDLLTAALGGRYCGTVSPYVRISLHRVLVLVFHSRAKERVRNFGFRGKYYFIPDGNFKPGEVSDDGRPCSFLITPSKRKRGTIHSPTYPGTYPKNFHCSYLLSGKSGQRIRLMFRDFDVYFGGEHCPYDTVTIYDGDNAKAPIIKKLCGLQLRAEMYSVGPNLLIHFNSTDQSKGDPRGFVIEYEFSSRFVDVTQLLDNQHGVTHMRGTECDVLVQSNRESHTQIQSPGFPFMYPGNSTCTYLIDGLQGEQNLEKVILTFQHLAVMSDTSAIVDNGVSAGEDVQCPSAWVGVAVKESSMRAALSSSDESVFEHTLCDRIPPGMPSSGQPIVRMEPGSALLGPFESEGPRMVVQFGTTDRMTGDDSNPVGFLARIQFKTDFGVAGTQLGDTNTCSFKFTAPIGSFNSPRYPANYPSDTNCTYLIEARPDQQILIHFEQYALYRDGENNKCDDWIEVFDVFDENGHERARLKERYCQDTFPGPTISAFGAHKMRVLFSSDSFGTSNGFKALYEIRTAKREDIPTTETAVRCGKTIVADDSNPAGVIISPGFPVKYYKDIHCDWLIVAKPGRQVLLSMAKLDIEGDMTGPIASCQKAVVRVAGAPRAEYCGTETIVFTPFVSENNTVRISFITAPDKVSGLSGFNLTWTEVRQVQGQSECSAPNEYLCTFSKLCINSLLLCNGDRNCGPDDDSDERRCDRKENTTDATVIVAAIFCGFLIVFICGFFCFLFKKKFERKKKQGNNQNSRHRQRQPYRSQRPVTKNQTQVDTQVLTTPATSRYAHPNATAQAASSSSWQPPTTPDDSHSDDHIFYG